MDILLYCIGDADLTIALRLKHIRHYKGIHIYTHTQLTLTLTKKHAVKRSGRRAFISLLDGIEMD